MRAVAITTLLYSHDRLPHGRRPTDKRDKPNASPFPRRSHGEVKVYQPMTILDISHGGAQIETPFALQLDSLHDFRISLGDRSVVVKGRIAHCHIGELKEGVVLYRTGVEFIEISDHVQAAMLHFVEAAQDLTPPPAHRRRPDRRRRRLTRDTGRSSATDRSR